MKKIIVIFLSISITLASNNELFEKLSKAFKNKFNIHTLDDLNRLKSKNKKNQESILNRTRNMSDFIGEWASVSQEVSMHITVGTDQSVPEMGSVMGMNPANGGITVSNDNFTTELNYMMAVDPFGGLNLSSAFNNSRIERDTETYIFEFESLSDMNYARYGAGYTTDNEYIYAFGGADSEGVHNHGERYDPDTDTVLAAMNQNDEVHIASLTKLMSMYVVSDSLNKHFVSLDDKIKISKKAAKIDGSRMFVNLGSLVSVNELVDGVIITSGNDATIALAEFIGGNEESFVGIMNDYAKQLSMEHSHFMVGMSGVNLILNMIYWVL